MSVSPKEANGETLPDVEFEIKDEDIEESPTKPCHACSNRCLECLKPVLAEYHPLPNNPDLLQRLHFAFLCPPHGRLGACIFVVLVGMLIWGVLWSVTGKQALPGGNIFSLVALFIFSWCGGYIVNLIKLPPLLGK